jgi:hypothetical protein
MTARTIAPLVVAASVALGSAFAQGDGFPKGAYTATRRAEKWTLRFDDKGTFAVLKGTEAVAEGTYRAMKDQIEFADKKGPRADPKAKPGRYRWKLEGKTLRFTKVEDESKGRAAALTSLTWTRAK